MSRRKEIDIGIFLELYFANESYPQMAKQLNCCVSVLDSYRLQLHLPKREKASTRKEIDEKRFRDMYLAGKSYKEIGGALNISQNSVLRHRLRLGLPDRDLSPTYCIYANQTAESFYHLI